ncbi:N-acetylglucosaminyldiphosphoundecaprenol N-acetyl-beta-D-mannosaminyltransferase TarA [Macrococcus capreoli]|uniref:N-acetylglucosaminyldiphosphoundecaprenol N-acetyl-beta-D-mannosaminyltransferase TarA n=1 Tax=Macrococcus capreoli TaxID=2982690 RepID=UPI003F505806
MNDEHISLISEQLPIERHQRFNKDTITILDVPFDNVTKSDMIQKINTFVQQPGDNNLFIVTANPEIVYYAKTHEKYLYRIMHADYIIPDGIGIIKAAKYLNQPLTERIPGIELMEEMLKVANLHHKKVFLLGASKETVKQCKKNLREQYPNIIFKSKHGYKDIHDYKTLLKIKKFEPDFVFVAMGYPKQESFIYYYQHHFKHTVFMGVGGSFDVFSGNVKRAPVIFRKMNLEWFYRIITDWKRLKRSVMIPLFLSEVVKQKHALKDAHDYLKDKA